MYFPICTGMSYIQLPFEHTIVESNSFVHKFQTYKFTISHKASIKKYHKYNREGILTKTCFS